jgi:type IV pilus assembly protein PilN
MKPIHLNLAARPYRDYRPVYAAVVAMSLLTAFLMLNNIDTYYRYTHETRSTRAKIAAVEAQTQREQQNAQIAKNRLEQVDVGRLEAQTRFINAKLAERAFSWSALLDQLESILGDDVRLESVSPSFTEAGPINLSLAFESKSADGLIETMNAFHADPRFRNPFPSNESQTTSGYRFNLTVEYLPENLALNRTTSTPAVAR